MENKKISQVINSLEKKISAEGSSVTTFTYEKYTINYIDELVKYNQISKQKLYEMIIADKNFIENIINNSKIISQPINNHRIQIKQRISKKSLIKLNNIADQLKVSRDYIIAEAIQILHENLNKKIQANFSALTNVSNKVDDLYFCSKDIENNIKKNEYLLKVYSKYLDKINTEIDNLKSSIDEDLKNYKVNQWSIIMNEK